MTRKAGEAIARALRGLRYGSVEIVVHDGHVLNRLQISF
ncbi:MAG TPA: YezD family protein [Candidatus Polarisedimenticolia bacterium]|jgi:hypothetical protein|nr:YezD family protein [Candidatus Polarisedimenticolia bacterium]